ncbi:MAG TPA: cytochrome c oxidase subunit II [Ardenticatenaceae bacterium]
MTFGRITAILALIFAALVALVFFYPHMPWLLPDAAAREAEGIDNLMRLMFIVSMGIFVFVQGFLLYFVWIYRHRSDDDPDAVGRAIHGDNKLEIAWTIAPALFLVFLTIYSLDEFRKLNLDTTIEGAREVNVIGQQFFWTFEHPAAGLRETNTLTLEEGVPVSLHITGVDVIHAFWVPEFRVKQDATPGYVRTINLTPTSVGKYPLRCAEFCGTGHSQMLAEVQVLSAADYTAWETEALAEASNASAGVEAYVEYGCGGCHALEEADAAAAVGPTHEGLGVTAQERIEDPSYTGEAETPEEYIAESIRNPGAYVVPDYPNIMPAFGEDQIGDEELEALVQLLMEQE